MSTSSERPSVLKSASGDSQRPVAAGADTSTDSTCCESGAAHLADVIPLSGDSIGHIEPQAEPLVKAVNEACDPEPVEPCPTPLNWQQVITEFREGSEPWAVHTSVGMVRGRAYGEGSPLFLLNGITGNSELYALLAYTLREHFETFVFDLPQTLTQQSPPNVLPAAANCLLEAADHLNLDTFQVFGSSLGAVSALYAAHQQPQRIERLFLHGAFLRRKLSLLERLLSRLLRFCPGEVRHLPLRQSIFAANHRRWFPPFDGSRCEFLEHNTGLSSIALTARLCAGVGKIDLRGVVPNIKTPTTLIVCEGDGPMQQACHSELLAAMPHAEEYAMENSGPAPFVTHPHRCAKLVKKHATP